MNYKFLFVLLSFFIMATGAMGELVIKNVSLQGETIEESKADITVQNVWSGKWQIEFEDYLQNNLKIREWLIPIRNQIMYSFFHTSPNNNIAIGRENNLFEKEYIYFESQIYPPMTEREMDNLIDKLEIINSALEAQGKNLFIFITPSKAEVYSEDMPVKYVSIAPTNGKESNYNLFIEALGNTEIAFYDSIPYVNELKNSEEFPVFPTTGTHWSDVTASFCAEELADSMEEQLEINLPEAEVSYERCDDPIAPDSDIYNLLNLMFKPDENYYKAVRKITDANKEECTILARGGSFMGSSLYYGMIQEDYFTKSYYLENTVIRCSETNYSGTFDSYDDLSIKEMIEASDVILLEVNEEAIPRMSFGFIDYLLDKDILT